MRVQSITWMDPGRTRDTLSVSGLVLQVIRRLLLLHQFTRTLSETTESGFTEWWYQPTPIETRFLVPTRSACMLRMWLDHLLPHHLLNSSFLLLPLKRYWDSTPTILRANHPFYSNPSHQPSPPMPPGTRLFFGSQMPEIIQVFISSDIEVEVEFTFISESEFSVQKFKTQHKYFSSSLRVWWFRVHLATNNNFYRVLHYLSRLRPLSSCTVLKSFGQLATCFTAPVKHGLASSSCYLTHTYIPSLLLQFVRPRPTKRRITTQLLYFPSHMSGNPKHHWRNFLLRRGNSSSIIYISTILPQWAELTTAKTGDSFRSNRTTWIPAPPP